MNSSLTNFDEDQIKCVRASQNQPLIILAGPGSGKTRTIVGRIMYFISSKNIDPSEILGVCFSRKAAMEMKNRIMTNIGYMQNIGNITIKTFHSLCLQILRENVSSDILANSKNHKKNLKFLGLKKKFIILPSKRQRIIIRKILQDEKLQELRKGKDMKDLTPEERDNLIVEENKKKEEVTPNDVTATINTITRIKAMGMKGEEYEVNKELIAKYNKKIRAENSVDFSDLILLVSKLFRYDPLLLSHYQKKYKYILCDEFQDLNRLQFDILQLLTNTDPLEQNLRGRITIVGDEDQSIYKFRGGDPGLFEDFRKLLPNYNQIQLSKNYRSTPVIVSSCLSVISENKNRTEKTLKSTRTTPHTKNEKITIIRTNTEEQEINLVYQKVNELTKKEGYKYSDIAILCRQRKNILKDYEDFLKSKGIPIQKQRSKGVSERLVSSTILCYLALTVNKNDDTSFIQVINIPSRRLTKNFIDYLDEVKTKSKGKIKTYYKAARYICKKDFPKYKECRRPDKRQRESITKFLQLLKKFKKQARQKPLDEFVSHVVSKIDLDSEIQKQKKKTKRSIGYSYNSDEKEEKEQEFEFNYNLKENLGVISKIIVEFNKENNKKNTNLDKPMDKSQRLSAFIDYIRTLDQEDEEVEKAKDSIFVSTIHQAKGLEWKVVILIRCNEGICPSAVGANDPEHFSEERRLFYVGISRPKDKLIITALHNDKHFPSSFLQSVPPENAILEVFPSSDFIEPKYPFKLGDDEKDQKMTDSNQNNQQPQSRMNYPNQYGNRIQNNQQQQNSFTKFGNRNQQQYQPNRFNRNAFGGQQNTQNNRGMTGRFGGSNGPNNQFNKFNPNNNSSWNNRNNNFKQNNNNQFRRSNNNNRNQFNRFNQFNTNNSNNTFNRNRNQFNSNNNSFNRTNNQNNGSQNFGNSFNRNKTNFQNPPLNQFSSSSFEKKPKAFNTSFQEPSFPQNSRFNSSNGQFAKNSVDNVDVTKKEKNEPRETKKEQDNSSNTFGGFQFAPILNDNIKKKPSPSPPPSIPSSKHLIKPIESVEPKKNEPKEILMEKKRKVTSFESESIFAKPMNPIKRNFSTLPLNANKDSILLDQVKDTKKKKQKQKASTFDTFDPFAVDGNENKEQTSSGNLQTEVANTQMSSFFGDLSQSYTTQTSQANNDVDIFGDIEVGKKRNIHPTKNKKEKKRRKLFW